MVLSITGSLNGGAIGHGRRTVADAIDLAQGMVAEGYRDVRVVDLDTLEVLFAQDAMEAD